MQMTIALDDDLFARASAISGLTARTDLLNEALLALIERESARKLARLGGTEPDLVEPPRRRFGER